ncbi:hypothetical protein GOP47_0018038 [Adiantum capillus-veneris]|uniref:Nudix hydrolase domain-containing protein n=1 Tax=Adiantum capillus-veneris TaxID=13818 RepID=A0A9D4ZBG2_ADICA|nr:hypothetical protein GOP47_0018038 [Adiantum capillus-veneris]
MATVHPLRSVFCSVEDGSLSSRHELPKSKPRPVYVICQAHQSSRDGSLTLDKNAFPLFSVIDIQEKSDFLRKAHFFVTTDRARLPQWVERPTLLKAEEDCYDGVIVDPTCLPKSADEFVCNLRASLSHWKGEKKRGVWLLLPSHLAEFVPLAIKEGFQYHHAEPSHVMMTFWIPDTPCTLPPNASHQVGIGAFVMNDRREVLAVQEKDGPLRGSGVWKMPTGLINQGEDLCAGAVREVKEETGVDTAFQQVVGFRHGHFVSFCKSDLYFVCTLRPLSSHVVEQKGEIEAARWMPLEEFRDQAFYTEHKARRNMLDLCLASWDGLYTGFTAQQLQSSSLARPTQYFFHETVS